MAAISLLENAPDAEKDWHPRSNNQALDLIHPSLCPIVYNCTLAKDLRTGECEVSKPPGHRNYSVSLRSQWLPSDFAVAEDGAVTLVSSYINSVHSQKHAGVCYSQATRTCGLAMGVCAL